jgi:hypothetical protein
VLAERRDNHYPIGSEQKIHDVDGRRARASPYSKVSLTRQTVRNEQKVQNTTPRPLRLHETVTTVTYTNLTWPAYSDPLASARVPPSNNFPPLSQCFDSQT